jgi:DNA-binding CsgD family transcriptional regulator
MTASRVSKPDGGQSPDRKRRPLSAREREIMGRLADGLSGAQIAKELVLSPETVRTHVRNAMEKLGAATRSQAVALALETGEIGAGPAPAQPGAAALPTAGSAPSPNTSAATLTALLAGVSTIADIESGSLYLAEDGGMLLRLAAHAGKPGSNTPSPVGEVALGAAGIGRVALERRAQLISATRSSESAQPGPVLAAPMSAQGRLMGVLALGVRNSRLTSRRELLLIEAFAARVAEVLTTGGETAALSRALKRFRASWTGTLEI